MRYLILYTIRLYQILFSPFQALLSPTAGCRFYPACSVYTYNAVKKHGILLGLSMGIKRLLKCNPWSS